MKLRNKKTGEIGEFFCSGDPCRGEITLGVEFENEETVKYNSLSKMAEEWEDYDYLSYWYIDSNGDVLFSDLDGDQLWEDLAEERKSIGNYFETKEEAEKAVEKLKAWKRLKDKNFKFYGWNKGSLLKDTPNNITFACDDTRMWTWCDVQDDLDLLFGGEE